MNMKTIIFGILFGFLAISCKKKEDPIPVSKNAMLEIEYKTFAPNGNMNIWYNINNLLIDNSLKDTSYFKYEVSTKGDQTYNVSIKANTPGYRNSLLVKFNGDTLFYEYKMDDSFGTSGTLPFIQ
jgi:hypothetical protein